MSTDKVLNGTNIGLGAAIGLVIDPLMGLWLIRVSPDSVCKGLRR